MCSVKLKGAEPGVRLHIDQSQILSWCKVVFLILSHNHGSFCSSIELLKVEMSLNQMWHGYFRGNFFSGCI